MDRFVTPAVRRMAIAVTLVLLCATAAVQAVGAVRSRDKASQPAGPAVGAQYDSTHVYVAASDFDAFVSAFTATFGCFASASSCGRLR